MAGHLRLSSHILLCLCLAFASWPAYSGSGKEVTLKQAAQLWLERAFQAAGKDDWQVAEQNLRKFTLTGVANPRADQLHAYVLYRSGRYSEAARKYHRVLQAQPGSFAACYYLGKCLTEAGSYAQALEVLKGWFKCSVHETEELWYPTVGSEPMDRATRGALVLLARAECLSAWGEALDAIEEPEKAKTIHDRALAILAGPLDEKAAPDVKARLALLHGETLCRKGRDKEGQKIFLGLVERFPEYPLVPEALYEAARCAEKVDTSEQAAALFQRLIDEHPGHPKAGDALVDLGLACDKSGDHQKALTILLRFLKTQTPSRFYTLGPKRVGLIARRICSWLLLSVTTREILKPFLRSLMYTLYMVSSSIKAVSGEMPCSCRW